MILGRKLTDFVCFLQALLTKLDSEKANVQADIEQGKRLQQDRNAPAFISQTVADLDRKWRDTTQLAQAKHAKLKVRSAVIVLTALVGWAWAGGGYVSLKI